MLAALVLSAAAAAGADPPFVGAQACSGCHAQQAKLHAESAHARSLSRPNNHRLAEALGAAPMPVRDGRFRFTVAAQDGALVIQASDADGDAAERLPVHWAFGAGDQAVTLVSQLDEDAYIEHHWSYYSAPDAYAVTPGHQGVEADDLGQAMGVRYRTFSPRSEIMRCFRCHSTGPLALSESFGIQPAELGVRCESCHGPGAEHVQAVSATDLVAARKAIENPGRLTQPELIARCGSCHRPPSEDPAEIDYRDPWNVRHQPVYLTQSACFQQSPTLTCMTCHDPHDRVQRNAPDAYRERCMSCHATEPSKPAARCGDLSAADCASCHMPKVRPHEHLAFTNHWIGVFESDDRLVPRD